MRNLCSLLPQSPDLSSHITECFEDWMAEPSSLKLIWWQHWRANAREYRPSAGRTSTLQGSCRWLWWAEKCSPKVLTTKRYYFLGIPTPSFIYLPWYRLQLFEKAYRFQHQVLTVDVSVMHLRCPHHSIFNFSLVQTIRMFIPQDTMMSMDCLRQTLSLN